MRMRWADYIATLAPPVTCAALWPDGFLQALVVSGTYGSAVLFGAVPALMAWRTRNEEATKSFGRAVSGGNLVLGAVVGVPLLFILSKFFTI